MNHSLKKFRLWEQVPMLRLLLPFIMGILLFDANPLLLSEDSIFILPVLILTTFSLLVFSINKPKLILANAISTITLLASLAYFICFHYDTRNNSRWFGHEKSSRYSLVVISKAEEKSKTDKYEVDVIRSLTEKSIEPAMGKAFVYIYRKEGSKIFKKGDTLLLRANWSAITNNGNPFEMDYQKFCARKNVFHQQFLKAEQAILYSKHNENATSFLDKASGYCIDVINNKVKDSTTNALLKAMIVGEEKDIDPNTREAYSDTGIIHIVSISGAHVAIIFAAIGFLFGLIKSKSNNGLKMLLSLAIIWLYVLLAGASTPALRAATMFSILAIGNVSNQRANPLNQLFSTAFILLLVQPMWLFSIGFQLSFVAVLSLIIFYVPLASLFKPTNKIALFFTNAIAASVAAEILVAPLVAYYFHSFPVMFILANVLASLTMGAMLVLGVLLILFAKISFLATLISTILIYFSIVFHKGIFLLQQVEIEAFKTIYLPFLSLLLIYLFIASLIVTIGLKKKNALWVSACSIFIMALLHLQRSIEINTQKQLIVYNQSKEVHCEYIDANSYSIMNGTKEESTATKNTHIALGTIQKEMPTPKALFLIGGKKILLIDSNTNTNVAFPVDVIIVKSIIKNIDVAALAKAFSVRQIVIANNQYTYLSDKWESQCKQANIALHNTKTDGAFIIQ